MLSTETTRRREVLTEGSAPRGSLRRSKGSGCAPMIGQPNIAGPRREKLKEITIQYGVSDKAVYINVSPHDCYVLYVVASEFF